MDQIIAKPEETRDEQPEAGEYVAPSIQTFSPEQFLDLIGPAQGYGGRGGDHPRDGGGSGRGPRILPGLR